MRRRLASTHTVTGRQLVALAAIVAVTVLLIPMGVQAAGRLVTIVSPDSARQVQVDTIGHLMVGDGDGPLSTDIVGTGTAHHARVDGSGHLLVTGGGRPLPVRGTLNARPATSREIKGFVLLDGNPRGLFGGTLFSGGTRVALASLTVANTTSSTQTFGLDERSLGGASTCKGASGAFHRDAQITVPPRQTLHFTYPEALLLSTPSSGSIWCVRATPFRAGAHLAITVVGYRT